MVSIIICSKNKKISDELNENIENTIGIEYELIIINNSQNNHSISSAYNIGVSKAKYEILCFMHDDILFHTIDWGKKVLKHFENQETGLIGNVGTHFLPDSPTGWYQSMLNSGGTYQRFVKKNDIRKELIQYHNFFKSMKSIEAVAVDGMWFCMRKEIFDIVSFDEIRFNGFHCYDLDICLQVRKHNYKVIIISDILIEHFSRGHFTMEWVKQTELLYDKWKDMLPQIAGINITEKEKEIRTKMVSEIYLWMKVNAYHEKKLQNIRRSYAYRTGKTLIKPFSRLYKLLRLRSI